MSQPPGAYPWWSGAHRLAGTMRLLLGFVIGAVVALLPMYYFQMGREAGLRGTGGSHDSASSLPADGTRAGPEPPASGASKPFASRMTYELSQLPQELPPPKAPPPAAAPVAIVPTPVARSPVKAAAPPPAPVPEPLAERVANARPISAVPPDPRDRTREIEKEGLKAEYREPPRTAKPAPSPPVGKVIEGREVDLKPKPPESAKARAGKDAGKKAADMPAAVEPGPQVAGVSPIRPPETGARSDDGAAAKPGAVGAKTVPAPPASADVQSRLEATREWIAAAPPTTHTIQLMGTNSEEQLKGHLKSLSKLVDPAKLYIYRTMAQGKPSITVVYGAYADRASASQALEKLPPSITANKPVLRTVNGIRAEMKQNKTDS